MGNEKLHSVSFESSGNVSHGFDDLVREVASNLSTLVAEADCLNCWMTVQVSLVSRKGFSRLVHRR